jgi:hypothetical protein
MLKRKLMTPADFKRLGKLEANVAHRMNHLKHNHLTSRSRAVMLANVMFLVWGGPEDYYRTMNMDQEVIGIECECCQAKNNKVRDKLWSKLCPQPTTPTLSN